MSGTPIPIKLIRYLNVWRINRPLVWLPRYPAIEISYVLGSIVSNRLSTAEAVPWKKALSSLAEFQETISKKKAAYESVRVPEVEWPIDAVIFVYPGKTFYGQGEIFLWELKLLGDSADHSSFLELILPAMEEAGFTSERKFSNRDSLWGKFDIQAVYAAHGETWEPVVSDGRLDLRYTPTKSQWSDALNFEAPPNRKFKRLRWITPYFLEAPHIHDLSARKLAELNKNPGIDLLLHALLHRISQTLPGRRPSAQDVLDAMDKKEKELFQKALENSQSTSIKINGIEPTEKFLPGLWQGHIDLSGISKTVVPYLELASILHLGKLPHFGCGTFKLT